MKIIDDFLNSITMYRLVLYYLLVLVASAIILSFFKLLPFDPLAFIFSTIFLMAVGWITNKFFATVLKVPTNTESIYISSLILALIITPSISFKDLPLLFWSAIWIAASKFIFNIKRKHLFNPAALAVVIASLAGLGSASWWVGTLVMMPQVLLGGLLIVKKIRRWDLVLSFFAVSLSTIIIYAVMKGDNLMILTKQIFFDSPILFFAFVMLTEPQTTPPTKWLQIYYGALVGFLFAPQIHIGSFYSTPEIALILGNIFSYLVSPKEKLILILSKKTQLASNIYDFVFKLDQKLTFLPGQYMEWTLGLKKADDRGNRRYFTLASAPTEGNLRIGVRISDSSSSFKQELVNMKNGDKIVAGCLSGDFVLPQDPGRKFVFIAGGIGITPFRSIIKNMIDNQEKRDIALFYSVKNTEDEIYMDVFRQAQSLGLRTFVNVSAQSGPITKEIIISEVADFKQRSFYLSGPHGMVDSFEKTLTDAGLKKSQIKTDYFPGY